MIAGYNNYDVISLAIIVVFALFGLTGGFIRQITRLVGLLLGGWLAIQYGPTMIQDFGATFGQGAVIIVPLLLFIVVYLGVVILGALILKLMKVVIPGAGLVNRLLGLILGIVKGGIMVYVITAILVYASSRARVQGLNLSGSEVYGWVKTHPITDTRIKQIKHRIKSKVINVLHEKNTEKEHGSKDKKDK